jgi:hypothetical protein
MKCPIQHNHSWLFSCFPFVEPLQTIHRIGRGAAARDYLMSDTNSPLAACAYAAKTWVVCLRRP